MCYNRTQWFPLRRPGSEGRRVHKAPLLPGAWRIVVRDFFYPLLGATFSWTWSRPRAPRDGSAWSCPTTRPQKADSLPLFYEASLEVRVWATIPRLPRLGVAPQSCSDRAVPFHGRRHFFCSIFRCFNSFWCLPCSVLYRLWLCGGRCWGSVGTLGDPTIVLAGGCHHWCRGYAGFCFLSNGGDLLSPPWETEGMAERVVDSNAV